MQLLQIPTRGLPISISKTLHIVCYYNCCVYSFRKSAIIMVSRVKEQKLLPFVSLLIQWLCKRVIEMSLADKHREMSGRNIRDHCAICIIRDLQNSVRQLLYKYTEYVETLLAILQQRHSVYRPCKNKINNPTRPACKLF